jgi:hypothetical protein
VVGEDGPTTIDDLDAGGAGSEQLGEHLCIPVQVLARADEARPEDLKLASSGLRDVVDRRVVEVAREHGRLKEAETDECENEEAEVREQDPPSQAVEERPSHRSPRSGAQARRR